MPIKSLPVHLRRLRIRKQIIKRTVLDIIMIVLGILSAAVGLKGFLLPNNFLDGGVTGISLLLKIITGIRLPVLLVVVNIPFILMGFSQVSKIFAIKTFLAIIGLSVCIAVIPFPTVTSDKLLIAIFGGFFLGAGIGLSMRGGSVLDGTEILAVFISRQSVFTVGDVITVMNILIFLVAALVVNIETAMYAMLTYLAASKTVDFLVNGIEEYVGMTIISDQSEIIRRLLIHKLGRGITIYKGKKGYGKKGEVTNDIDIIYTVVTRLEVQKLKNEITRIDDKAFIVQTSVIDTKGGMMRRRPLQ